jgi:hypothetical protein
VGVLSLLMTVWKFACVTLEKNKLVHIIVVVIYVFHRFSMTIASIHFVSYSKFRLARPWHGSRRGQAGLMANFVSGQLDIARPYTCRRAPRSPHQSLEDATAATTLGERWGAAPTSSEEVQATAPTSAVGAGKQLCRPVARRLCARQ